MVPSSPRYSRLLVLGALLLGCGPSGNEDVPCADPQPTFTLHISAEGGVLPEDTSLEVRFGGGSEIFLLSERSESHEVIFCSVQPRAGGAGGAGGEAGAGPDDAYSSLECELWTDGAASVALQGGDFPRLEEQLVAEADACGIRTVRVELRLSYDVAEDE